MIIPTTCSSSPGMDASKAMTGTVRAAHKRREGAVGVSSREAASEGHPGAVPLKAVGGNGHPPLPGHECAGAPAKLGGTTECYGGLVQLDEDAKVFLSPNSQKREFNQIELKQPRT